MQKTVLVRIAGVTPTLQHNGQLANPLNGYVKEMKKITPKKKKTDDDLLELARLEFEGSLYLAPERMFSGIFDYDKSYRKWLFEHQGKSVAVCWPSENIESMLIAGARKSKEGKVAQSTVMVDQPAILEYAGGPLTAAELWQRQEFRLQSRCVIGQSSVMRTRPMFSDWKASFFINYQADMVNPRDIERWLQTASNVVGLSDWRPKYGRFNVEQFEELELATA